MRRARGWFLLLLPAGLISFPLAAQTATVRGQVSDSTGKPLGEVTVVIEQTGLRTTTNSQGHYEIRGIPLGSYTLHARLIGYVPMADRVAFSTGEPVTHDFTLAQSPFQMAAIDVVVGSRARHTAAEELAVPVDVYTSEQVSQQGTSETGQILAALSPSSTFPTRVSPTPTTSSGRSPCGD